MPLSTRYVSDVYSRICHNVQAEPIVRAMLIDSLSPWHKQALERVTANPHKLGTTARYLADAEHIAINHASTLLKQLRDLGVLKRTPVVANDGLEYYYRPRWAKDTP